MPVKIYVGNYPSSFKQDDVLNLFQDYEGIELVGFFKNKKKCYSFLHCIDEHQLVEIVTNLNAIDVCGRNLIVRAADENFQKQIEESILKYDVGNYHPKDTSGLNSSTSMYENTGNDAYSKARSSKQSLSSQMTTSDSKNTYSKNYQMGASAFHSNVPIIYDNDKRIAKQNKSTSNSYENHNYFSQISESDYSSQQNNRSVENSFGGCRAKGAGSYQNVSESERKKPDLNINPQEAFSKSKTDTSVHYKTIGERFESYKTDSARNRQSPLNASHQTSNFREGYHARNRNTNEYSLDAVQIGSYQTDSMYNRENSSVAGYQTTNLREQYENYDKNISDCSLETVNSKSSSQQYENLSYISVMNFPLYLPTRNLYELFSDFNPLKVLIVCNKPRVDKAPTEAIICFENDKDATNAILTLDNTVYRGRVLLVTDAVDMSLVSELLSII
ncbi:hypothetical protein HNY73_016947 [Argiope bruennichi]|uniref:RRM domain-containing protein n=1 Tax=Argiope bruennichi TaxID=94029 RepID=A0A8T0EK23_ARGBR|nr:hypothetical protein HNY73_016947 [Argiope bruennichi]